ncbi:hypothetical protein O1V64_16210 [Rouxiella badensis]|nr:hypothetical protein O1V64_16210 [Rouxiella badensis]
MRLKGKALAGSAKAANKVADMLVHKKGTDSLSNVSDMRAKSAKAVSLARTELKEAFSFVEHRWQETQKNLHALQTTSQNEFTLAKAQLTAMEKDDPRKLPAQPEDISQQRKKWTLSEDSLQIFKSVRADSKRPLIKPVRRKEVQRP